MNNENQEPEEEPIKRTNVLDIESENRVKVDFSRWTLDDMADLLRTIIAKGTYEFSERVIVEYEPPLKYESQDAED